MSNECRSISTPAFPTTNPCCLNLVSPFFCRTITIGIVFTLAFPAFAWTLKSRELVDIEFATNGALTVLVSAPGADSPGLYQWKPGAAEPTKVCAIPSPSFFSFNRRIVIERVRDEPVSIRLYNATTCALVGEVKASGRALDADARGDLVAMAIQQADQARTLELYTFRGKRIATTGIGRNVELGFAPDGKTLLNFDLSDGVNATWRVRSLARAVPPRWMNRDEVTFIPGAQYVTRYAQGTLSILHRSTGRPKYVTPAARTVRVRQLSLDGRYGVIHERLPKGDLLAWLDFATATRTPLGEGSIDHAAINTSGTHVAWSARSGATAEEVTIIRATVSKNGIVSTTN